MATVIAVRFQKAGKLYYFDPAGIWANPGDHVIVETVRGIEPVSYTHLPGGHDRPAAPRGEAGRGRVP